MPIRIGNNCIFCGACAVECPSSAISEGKEVFAADADRCFECVGLSGEPLCAQVCPVRAIEIPDEEDSTAQILDEAALLTRAKALLPGRELPEEAELTEATSRFRRKGEA